MKMIEERLAKSRRLGFVHDACTFLFRPSYWAPSDQHSAVHFFTFDVATSFVFDADAKQYYLYNYHYLPVDSVKLSGEKSYDCAIFNYPCLGKEALDQSFDGIFWLLGTWIRTRG